MKYIVMCVCDRGGDMPDPWKCEYSGTLHEDREKARHELMSIGRKTRKINHIYKAWIEEKESEDKESE